MARYGTLVIGIVYFLFACSAPFLIEQIGCRTLSIFQLSLCTFSLCFLSIFTWINNNFNNVIFYRKNF